MVPVDPGQLRWRTSSYTGSNGSCVEIAPVGGGAAIRDTKDRDGGILIVSERSWNTFLAAVKAGRAGSA
ncbi:DUF397 domain-containing protein [Actinoalloteichus sp. AHMU CJ021]|uniref:DUF397 domain-containing protein n=1 Tax=Actinoalloteichus TaxID=65496 RepID=UPI0004AA703B|nr:DUF397 domain-containing protein [Actinoalloteichus caeruleus]AUS79005.1 DUF397 domain-containing protein [Actinoalloteichus sp. AHMU CJ021]